MDTPEGQETNTQPPKSSNKATYIILALVLVVAVVLLWKSQVDKGTQTDGQKQEQADPRTIKPANAVSVPESYILSDQFKKTYSTMMQTPTGLQPAKHPTETTIFTSSKTKEELLVFYKQQLIQDGYKIVNENGTLADNNRYSIVALNYDSNRTVSIVILPRTGNPNISQVAISYREGINYGKK